MKLSNTLTRQKDELRPIDGNTVKIYTCGLTVYSQPHIGNWVGYIYWDVLVRTLMALDYQVERTQNITDVGHLVSDDDSGEDKIATGAKREGITAYEIADKYSRIADFEAYDLLKLIRPTHIIAATSCIDAQIAFAQTLDKKGYLYRTSDGMYFDTSKLTDYGKLARLDTAGLMAGNRVAMNDKHNPTDFAVWKFSPAGQKRDMEWPSPWGVGFPGWHLECSTIALETLGETIDIHAGGIDHIPVHHTNEIAQSEARTGKPFANIWLHNNHLKVDGQKMSKSLGNIVTLSDIIDAGYDLEAFKLLILSKHYRTEGNFTWEILAAAQNHLDNWRDIAALRHQVNRTINNDDQSSAPLTEALRTCREQILDRLADDLDTVGAIKVIDEAFSDIASSELTAIDKQMLSDFMATIEQLLGIDIIALSPDITDEQKRLILERTRVREKGDYQASDDIRDQLQEQGITLHDTKSGVSWGYYRHPHNR